MPTVIEEAFDRLKVQRAGKGRLDQEEFGALVASPPSDDSFVELLERLLQAINLFSGKYSFQARLAHRMFGTDAWTQEHVWSFMADGNPEVMAEWLDACGESAESHAAMKLAASYVAAVCDIRNLDWVAIAMLLETTDCTDPAIQRDARRWIHTEMQRLIATRAVQLLPEPLTVVPAYFKSPREILKAIDIRSTTLSTACTEGRISAIGKGKSRRIDPGSAIDFKIALDAKREDAEQFGDRSACENVSKKLGQKPAR